MNFFVPLMVYVDPSALFSAVVVMLARSLPPAGSVRVIAIPASPRMTFLAIVSFGLESRHQNVMAYCSVTGCTQRV